MKVTRQLTDEAVLRELGERLTRARLDRNLTQSLLAEEAGVSKRTVERLESGSVAARLSAFIRVCRALGLIERLERLLPESAPGPVERLKLRGKRRQRASTRPKAALPPATWRWGEDK